MFSIAADDFATMLILITLRRCHDAFRHHAMPDADTPDAD